MSSAAALQEKVVSGYIDTSANVLFLYESVITFCEEVDVIWRRKWSTMTCIYVLTRYCTIAQSIMAFSPYNIQPWSCKAIIYAGDVSTLMLFLCFAAFSALRVYALLDGWRIIAGLVFLLNLVPFSTNMFGFIIAKILTGIGLCRQFNTPSRSLGLAMSLVSRISVITGDVLVLVVTWTKTARLYREGRRIKMSTPLATLLIRDGTLHFVILLVINVLEVFGENLPILVGLNAVEPFFEVLPSIIVCRFILKLRQVKPAGHSGVSSDQSHSRFVGDMGESLRFDGDEEEDDQFEASVPTVIAEPESSELATVASNLFEAHSDGVIDSVPLDLDALEIPAHYDV